MHKIEVQFSQILARFAVSLFTGERIEIPSHIMRDEVGYVSLFTGERIEIRKWMVLPATIKSPSLRGSGLKYF